ncbi:MAG: hypothetical protein IJM51_12210 [Clostridia bacterium]|nr:hypothetical protein [Clostridia bacterium]
MNEKLTLFTKSREKTPFVTRGSTVSDDLKARTLAAMAQREQENAEKATEKQEKKAVRKNTLVRAAVIAAIITLIIVVTPIRGYVVSAAENAWNGIIEWIDGHGWINPFYRALDGYSEFPYSEQGGVTSKNARLTTQQISSEMIDFDISDFKLIKAKEPYTRDRYQKEINLNAHFDCNINQYLSNSKNNHTTEKLCIHVNKILLTKFTSDDYPNGFTDSELCCKIKGRPQSCYSEKAIEKKGVIYYPERYECDISSSSSVEFAFLKKGELCFKAIYNCSTDELVYTDDEEVYEDRLDKCYITWCAPKYADLIDLDSHPELGEAIDQLRDFLLIVKPDKMEISSACIIFEEKTDWLRTKDRQVMEALKNEGYNFVEEYYYEVLEDGSEKEILDSYLAHKINVTIFKGYNPKYYDVEKESKNNQKLIEEFNSRVG